MKEGVMKRGLSITLAIMLIFTSSAFDFSGVVNTYAAEEVDLTEETTGSSLDAASGYNLADNIEDGVILHAWNWSFNQIKAELKDIAEAGFTAVQTSPIQPNKEGANVKNTGSWWKFYQPLDFTVCENSYGNINKLGTKSEFKALCKEADKYGIKIVVDVVANHLANKNTGKNTKDERSPQIPDYLRNNDSYWRTNDYTGSSDSNRKQMTQAPIGMPDLNTHNKELQKIITDFLTEAQKCGADGFRFDAAKHIETPSDEGFSSKFWEKVKSVTTANDPNVFLYGEILNTAGPGKYNDVKKYTPYIRVTNNKYANSLRDGIKNKNADAAKFTNNDQFGKNANEWVLWNESHDTYAGNYGENTDKDFNDEEMALAWCAVAARTSPALYFSRPIAEKGDGAWKSASLGQHTDMYKDKRIAAINKFHNYFAGKQEYITTSDNVLVVERGTSGVALINFSRGSKSISIKMNKMADGKYKDQITGNEFSVSGGTLKGKIGSGGVAAIYNAPVLKTPEPTISKEGGDFTDDTLTLTIGLKDATSGTYKIGNASAKNYTSPKDITIGSDMAFGDSVTITLTATNESQTETKKYTFTKVEKVVNKAYISLPSDWSEPVYCYAYNSDTKNDTWPGVQMTKDSDTGYYVYEVPENIENPKIRFSTDDKTQRVPPDGETGLLFETAGSWLYKDGKWEKITSFVSEGKVTVKYVDASGKSVASSKTLKGEIGSSYTTTEEYVSGYILKQTPSNASGTYTKEDITVTYVYEEDISMKIISNVDDGTTFDTETQTIKISTVNATSGTYSVDDGPIRTFTESADVVIGQGKIADTKVTVDVTATNGTDTINKTFTYNKKFSGKIADEFTVNFGADKSSPQLNTTILTLKAIAEGGKPPYKYEFFVDEERVQASSSADSYTWKPTAGNHFIKVTVTDSSGNSLSSWKAYVIEGEDDYTKPSVTSFTADKTSATEGDTVKLTATAKGGQGALKYMFTATDANGNTTVISDYSSSASVDWKPSKGTYKLEVRVKDGKNVEAVKAVNDFVVTGKTEDNIEIKSLTTNKDSGAAVEGDTVKLSATAAGTGELQYKFAVISDEPEIIIQDYSTSNECSWNISKAGTYRIIVYVKDSNGNEVHKSKMGYIVNPKDSHDTVEITSFDTDKASGMVKAGDSVELSVKVTSGTSVKYKFTALLGDEEIVISDYSNNDTVTWIPQAEGNYSLFVYVADSDNNIVNREIEEYMVKANEIPVSKKVSVSLFKISKASNSVTAGQTVKMRAVAKGGSGKFMYQFVVKRGNEKNQIVRKYSSDNTCEWTPSKNGKYTLYAYVKDVSTGKVSKKSIKNYNVKSAIKIKTFSQSRKSSTAVVGDSIIIRANATGGIGSKFYRYFYKLNGKKYKLKDNKTSKKIIWAPKKAGKYQLFVEATDDAGNKAIKSVNYVVTEKLRVKSLKADKSSIKAGDKVKLSAAAAGGTKKYSYKFKYTYKNKSVTIRTYSKTPSVNFTPKAKGKYKITVYVRDAKNRKTQKYITIKVK